MERRFAARRDQILADAEVDPRLPRGLPPRLERFLDPFVEPLQRSEQGGHARASIAGLVSDLEYKNVESIAYPHDQVREPPQQFIGQSPWDHGPWFAELARRVGQELAGPDGVLVLDPSAFPKKGDASVGVQRQWCGRPGKIDNCQVGVYLAYVGPSEHAPVDVRLYPPKEWAKDKRRRERAGLPGEVRFRTRHELALDMPDERGPSLSHAWVAGDDEMGRCSWFREQLRSRGERYLPAVPSNTSVRDLFASDPPYAGRGRRPRPPFLRVDRWCAGVAEGAWQTIEVRAAEKGPVEVQAVWTPVQARTEGRASDVAEVLVVFRERQSDGTWKHDYLPSNASLTTPLAEYARVFKAEHRVEECLQRAEGEAGLADDEVRTWRGWHHHQALALVATWFLTTEARRGKKMDAGVDDSAVAETDRGGVGPTAGYETFGVHASHREPAFTADGGGTLLPLESTQPLAATQSRSTGITPTVELNAPYSASFSFLGIAKSPLFSMALWRIGSQIDLAHDDIKRPVFLRKTGLFGFDAPLMRLIDEVCEPCAAYRLLPGMKKPFPRYSDSRSGGGLFVKLDGEQHSLASAPPALRSPRKVGRSVEPATAHPG